MQTKIVKAGKQSLELAAKLIREGSLVAFPTETVYGLGANTFDDAAVRHIFKAKGRPTDNPLIVHIGYKRDVALVAKHTSAKAKKLMRIFWPGPLTLVLAKRKKIPAVVSAGLNTVAVRMPNHPAALALIRKARVPIAAPSANHAGKPSPTRAQHVLDDLQNKIHLILDGGATTIGVESTVLDLTASPPTLLRPGKITSKQIEKIIGPITTTSLKKGKRIIVKSPGMKYKHYAPKAKVILVKGKQDKVRKAIERLHRNYLKEGKYIAVLRKRTTRRMANQLFAYFRKCDKKGVQIILVESVREAGLGHALINRLEKAASRIVRV